MKPKIIVIVGPTASGKTALSVELALRLRGEVVSADSRQVYRGCDLGTGKVTREEMRGVPHHLLDVADPREGYTVADFVRDGRTAIDDIRSRGNVPIVVGGTFFYIDALLGRVSAPDVPPNEELRARLEPLPAPDLYELLRMRDPARAAAVDPANKRRLIRALEIVEAKGIVPPHAPDEVYDALTIGIRVAPAVLRESIRARLEERIKAGMIDEVVDLEESGIPFERIESLGIEYEHIVAFLKGSCDEVELRERITTKSYQYAKRQMTWLKRDATIRWVEPGDIQTTLTLVKDFLS
ncbi:MAG TPA: tRNA (adenosine(37)-N6)-dimethylallyltransferase MiaA [Candidatus Paceibacterota bacterium]|nr:tRNA (adenosine(37)-N6)-dimethylallyltransferase MiaA [Candidatus Paceibacterota bacterium]